MHDMGRSLLHISTSVAAVLGKYIIIREAMSRRAYNITYYYGNSLQMKHVVITKIMLRFYPHNSPGVLHLVELLLTPQRSVSFE